MPSYLSYLRQIMDAKDDNIESWITVRGKHIPIMKGQSKEEAVKSAFGNKSEKGGSKKAEVKKSGTTNAYATAAKERDNIIKQLRGSMSGKERMRLENRKKALENTMVKESNRGSELREELRREENVKNSGSSKSESKNGSKKTEEYSKIYGVADLKKGDLDWHQDGYQYTARKDADGIVVKEWHPYDFQEYYYAVSENDGQTFELYRDGKYVKPLNKFGEDADVRDIAKELRKKNKELKSQMAHN